MYKPMKEEYPDNGYPQGGLPPQGAYPQAGYPQGGYPPPGAYPQAGYPQGGYPPPGAFPQAGYPPGAVPQAGYAPGAVPQAGYPIQGGVPLGYPAQAVAYPPQPAFLPGYAGDALPVPAPTYGPGGNLGEDDEVKGFDFTEKSIRRSFIRKVYAILLSQLLVTLGFVSLFTFHMPTKLWVMMHNETLVVAMVLSIVCVIAMVCFESVRRKTPMNLIFLGIFTLVESFMLGAVSSVYNTQAVMMAVGITAVICLALTLFAMQTRIDFTMMGGGLFCAFLVLFLFGLIAMFIPRNNIVTLVYASFGALLFSLYLIYDTQLMMGGGHKYAISPEEYIFAALNLYLDVINLFLFILRIIGASRG